MDTRAIVYKALFGPRFRVCKDCVDSLSDKRIDERCEGAGKTACELLYSQSRVGVVGSQLFRAAGNTETCFSNPYFYCLYNNHLSKRVHVRASGVPFHMGVAARVLIWTVSA